MLPLLRHTLQQLELSPDITPLTLRKARSLYQNGQCLMLSQSRSSFEVLVEDEYADFIVKIDVADYKPEAETAVGMGVVTQHCGCGEGACEHRLASLWQLIEELTRLDIPPISHGKAYTREGMIQRVLAERREKAEKLPYSVEFATNPYGEHLLVNERGVRYMLTFRNVREDYGYCSCPDYATNKLGTCKHLMFAFKQWKDLKRRTPRRAYPFVEIHLDPLQDYQVAWFFPEQLNPEIQALIDSYFGENQLLRPERLQDFVHFLSEAAAHHEIRVRPEVLRKLEKIYNRQALEEAGKNIEPDFSSIRATLYDYQKEGVRFALFREAVILADEMGLGKTIQSIATAILKKEYFGFTRTLIVCPASLKAQWKAEIERFSDETADIVEGKPAERAQLYAESKAYFLIINYETILRDLNLLNRMSADFIILDEAQRIKNYETRTARAVKNLRRKHALAITGTPLENRLTDLYSIMDFLDPEVLSPLWEFSYQHCYFDPQARNRITGYYDLQKLKVRLKPLLLRREKREVIRELPSVQQINVPVELHPEQQRLHGAYAHGIARILRKKFKTPLDMQQLMLLLANMRMVCDSTYLIEPESNFSPKLDELRSILLDKLDLPGTGRKVIIFSEWTKMLGLIGKMLREAGIGFTELSGKVPIPKRDALVQKFFQDPACQVFLSTEAGGAGLNLQVADTVINFELPWNPAKKNQRIGRIDRLGQKAEHLTVINLFSRDSIEMQIMAGIGLKQSLFEGVLNEDATQDVVDFSAAGRAQFLQQLESMLGDILPPIPEPEWEEEWEDSPEPQQSAASPEAHTQAEGYAETPATGQPEPQTAAQSPETQHTRNAELEQVMSQGMSFLAGMFKLATGRDMAAEGQQIEFNPATGEVVLRFKMPG